LVNDSNPGHIETSTPIGRLYQAQLLKDHAMGYCLSKLMLQHQNDRILVIAGIGHLKHYLGVPERLEAYLRAQSIRCSETAARLNAEDALEVATSSSVMMASQMLYELDLEDGYGPLKEVEEEESQGSESEQESLDAKSEILNDLFLHKPDLFDELVLKSEFIQERMFHFGAGSGKFLKPLADYCFVYDEDDDNFLPASCPAAAEDIKDYAAKAETKDAYNKVGETAGNTGNLVKAKAIMSHLLYTEEEMDVIGDDYIYNFQGVANPHRVAQLEPGEHVLDLGSGLGVDTCLASQRVTAAGWVLGVDLAAKQVAHAQTMAQSKGLTNAMFIQGDAEKLSDAMQRNNLQESKFDACISNGAFCLIPNKKLAFRQVFDALKPGGRMAISTTTIQTKLNDQDFDWPVCMQMFADLNQLQPMCEEVGFQDVEIIDAESPMEMEFAEDEMDNPRRFKIHGKYADQYAYLESMNMDQLCKIVTVYGVKPL